MRIGHASILTTKSYASDCSIHASSAVPETELRSAMYP